MTLLALPPQPTGVPWPTEAWSVDAPPASPALASLLDEAFTPGGPMGETQSVVVVQGGRLVLERYGEGRSPETTCHSWSMAKSITHALVGFAVMDGLLDVNAPADVPEWSQLSDPRGAITLDELLRMSSGLAFVEEYEQDRPSDVQEMLWGAGKSDVAHFAASFPLAHPKGAWFAYASGTSNIVSRCVGRAMGLAGTEFAAFMRQRLFEPLGMTSAAPKFDAAGTFIGSSFCFATPRDFARFGLLYLRDGVWDGRRLLPEGWVDYGRTPTWQQPGVTEPAYGAHWWLDLPDPGTFSANGYQGQRIILCPRRDLIVVRNGVTPANGAADLRSWIAKLSACFG